MRAGDVVEFPDGYADYLIKAGLASPVIPASEVQTPVAEPMPEPVAPAVEQAAEPMPEPVEPATEPAAPAKRASRAKKAE